MRARLGSLLQMVLLLALTPLASATTWYVNGVSGSDSNNCVSPTTACKTIGHAISLAASGDSIRVAAATYKENLGIGSLNIVGSSAKTTIIDGGGVGTVVFIGASAHATLSKLTIRNGSARTAGGGIYNLGTLTLSNSTISGNIVTNGGTGGGIFSDGPLTISNSTISGNSVSVGSCREFCLVWGGGIANGGPLTINHSTISGNSANRGGGIFFQTGGVLTIINNSTIGGNVRGGGIWNRIGNLAINNSTIGENIGGGIANGDFSLASTLTISNSTIRNNIGNGGIYNYPGSGAAFRNSIIANNQSGNCFGVITSHGYNLSSDSTCDFDSTGDLKNTDPMLGPLQNNGGPTQTMALPSGSPAIDAGNPSGCTDGQGHLLKTDQRGMPRPDPEDNGVGCDMGAFERQSD